MKETTTPIYRIFLSSIAIDMEEHHKKVSDEILRLGNLPVQLKTFGAQRNDPVEICQNKVRECDALVVMVAHRYARIPGKDKGGDGHKSITWIEVETALKAGKPVFAFLVDLSYPWAQLKEQDFLVQTKDKKEALKIFEKVQALKEFRTYLESKDKITRNVFTSPEYLAIEVTIILMNWVRETISAPGRDLKQSKEIPRVFLCYVREDVNTVADLRKALEDNGIKVWQDKDALMPGQRWKQEIKRAIQKGDFFVACFSENYWTRKRTYMNEELNTAIEELRLRPNEASWFIPVKLTPCEVPDMSIGGSETLRDIQCVDLHNDWKANIKIIVRTIKEKRL